MENVDNNLNFRLCYLQYAEGALVSHPDEASHRQFEDHVPLEGYKVAYVLQNEVPRAGMNK